MKIFEKGSAEEVGTGIKACHYFRDGKKQIDFVLVYEICGGDADGKMMEFR